MSRPTKFTKKKREEYLEHLRHGALRGDAAEAVGVTRQTVRKYRNEDPDFAKLCEQAELDAHDAVEDALYEAATSGNVTACIFYLKNRVGERWKDVNRFEGAVAQTHEIETNANVSIDDERARTLRRIMGLPEEVCLGEPVDSSRADGEAAPVPAAD